MTAEPHSVAINVGANTNQPGFRGPIYADGAFEFVPIPETEPTTEPVPAYGDLSISFEIPEPVRDTPVHLDPEFADYGLGERYTYGDPYGVKARPLLELSEGDHVLFYATLTYRGDGRPIPWINQDWGAYLIGRFELARDPIPGDEYETLNPDHRAAFANNAHTKRDPFDAAVLLLGNPDTSGLFEVAIPLSDPDRGTEPNRIVTDLSADSGNGPWWRRPLRFDAEATSRLLALEAADDDAKTRLSSEPFE